MAANNPYEVEHNIKAPARPPHRRRPDMSSFTSQLHQISRDSPDSNTHSHVGPTPVDAAGLYHLVHDQFATLFQDSPSAENQTFLTSLMSELQSDIEAPPGQIPGVRQEYLDSLDRVPKKQLKKDDTCPICAEDYLDDPYPLVVELPCEGHHKFDLECVGPWLQSKGTCPMCRKDLTKKKVIEIPKDDEEEEDDVNGLYG
ncbi:uncharacterized protein GGS22DRAFT_154941 [Annulohypoxylon maeteangense]|uniref:uncharacterized protein n=1 Tax=Annulohypoxylon maeteangense TaxID=1927788 RepID=UPI002007C7AE|nr:uncharacterized protein GGS22DRAFT_154941 [Annulohypoxylon maeteangense]KAI0888034.1 hypothetical protein GGS22DRAFT_154941 [Annulohypoxylon maeteangense]